MCFSFEYIVGIRNTHTCSIYFDFLAIFKKNVPIKIFQVVIQSDIALKTNIFVN